MALDQVAAWLQPPLIGPVAAAIVAVYYASSETLCRARTGVVRSWSGGEHDKGTTRALLLLHVLYVSVPWIVRPDGPAPWTSGRLNITPEVALVGVGLMLAGTVVRWWAMTVLGAAFSRTLTVQDGQRVITAGPFGVVRHPGYAGMQTVAVTYRYAGWAALAAPVPCTYAVSLYPDPPRSHRSVLVSQNWIVGACVAFALAIVHGAYVVPAPTAVCCGALSRACLPCATCLLTHPVRLCARVQPDASGGSDAGCRAGRAVQGVHEARQLAVLSDDLLAGRRRPHVAPCATRAVSVSQSCL